MLYLQVFILFLIMVPDGLMNDFEISGPQPGPQEEFLAARQPDGDIIDIVICGGEFFGGKSIALAMEAGRNVDHPKYRGDIFRRTYKQLTDSGGMCDICSMLYPQLGGVPTDSRLIWKFPSGATVLLHHLQHDSDVYNYRSSQFCFLAIDQVEEFPFNAVFYLRGRNRPGPGYDRPAYARFSCNPEPGELADFLQYYWDKETGYHTPEKSGHIRYFTREHGRIIWVKKDYRDPEGNKPTSVAYIYMPRSSNVIGMTKDPSYNSRLKEMDEVSYERGGKGNWKINYAGGMFRAEWFKIIKELPRGIRWIRYWDFAASEVKENEDPDYTAGVLIGELGGDLYIKDVIKFREEPGYTIKRVIDTAREDGPDVAIRWEEEKGSAGKFNTSHLSGKLLGYDAQADEVHGKKVERAKPLSSAAMNGHVFLLEASWNSSYLSSASIFPLKRGGVHIDEIDASTGGMKCLMLNKRIWPCFTMSQMKELKVNWKSNYSSNVLHYGALVRESNGSVYMLCTLWDKKMGALYIYACYSWDTTIPQAIAVKLITTMRMKYVVCNRLVANSNFFEERYKNISNLLNKSLRENSVSNRIVEPVIYDREGAIVYMNVLFENGLVIVSNACREAGAQFAGWGYDEDGRRPLNGFPYAEALCLISTELKQDIAKEAKRKERPDYPDPEQWERSVTSWQAV